MGEDSVSDYYYDDPVEESSPKRFKFNGFVGLVLFLFAGGTFLQTTLAANINLNSGGRVEFGQGVSVNAACAGSSNLTVTPISAFSNGAGAGAYYLSGLTVTGIPSSCHGKDFQISAFDNNAGSSALPIFNGTQTTATVYNNDGTFVQGFQGTGSTVSSFSGGFTVSFSVPVALASNTIKFTLQSIEHKDWAQTAISNGNNYSCTLLNSSAVKCWGANDYGNLGDGTTTQRLTPTTVSGLGSGVSAIAAGDRHACAVLATGTVRCWGTNNFGQLGDGTTTQRNTPVNVAGLSGVSAMSVGAHFSCALLRTGGVQCWGRGTMVGNGAGGEVARYTPVNVSGLSSGVIAIASGNYHTCAVLNTGAVRCWGADGRGAVGNGGGGNSPGTITGLSASAIGITGGDRHTCALLSTGGVQCWGWNDLGQIGITPGDNSNPQTVSGISSAVALSAGGQTSCALLSSGAVNCWGAGGNGQRGNGTTTDSHIPVTVSGISTAISISNGYNHACALISSGAARCWGSNGNGRLGDGTTNNSLTPVNVSGLP
jgi:alpha-tubulin suppressor-like RCC1 family protein